MSESLDQLLPAYYRVRDDERSGALAAVMEVIEREVDILDRDMADLYDDWFIETCKPWLVPYLGDLLGVRPLQPVDGVVTPRAYVANTLGYRRRKGTAPVLEQLAADVTGWPARVVEYFRLVGATQHMAHLRPGAVQSPDLRRSAALELLDGPFDSAAHTVDVRRINSDHRAGGSGGDHNIANIGLFLWRLRAFPLVAVDALPATEPSDGTYHFDPTGRDIPLFNTPAVEANITQLAAEVNVPSRLRRRALYDETEGLRQALTNGSTPDGDGFLDGDPAFEVFVQANPGDPFLPVPPAEIAICRLEDWHRPPPVKTYTPTDHLGIEISGAIPQSQPITVAVDPELGRLSFPEGEVPNAVRVNHAYGFSGELGAGPYSRVGKLPWIDPEERPVTWQRGVSADPAVVAADPDRVHPTIDAAVIEWNAHVAANPGAFGVIAVLDSSTHDVSTTIEVGVGGFLGLVGARWPLLDDGRRDLGGFVPDTVRPHIRGELTVRGTAPAAAANPGGVAIDGLLIDGGLRVAAGQLGSLHLGHCTVVPDSPVSVGGGAGGRNPRLELVIERSICGRVAIQGDVPTLRITDSLVGEPLSAAAVTAPDADVTLDSVTLFGALSARTLHADNSILSGAVSVQRTQEGCMRFCLLAADPGDPTAARTPRRHRCQPDLALASAEPGTEDRVLATILASFTSTEWGHPGFGQLAATTPSEITTGSDDDAEMGAFRFLAQPQRLTNLKTVLDEYLPVGLEAGPLLVT